MGKMEQHFESLNVNVDLNSNTEKSEEEFVLYDLLDIALQAGRWVFFGTSYEIVPSQVSKYDFTVRNHRRFKLVLRILHFWFYMFLILPFLTESVSLSPCGLVNMIKKLIHIALTMSMIAAYYCLEIRGRQRDGGLLRIYQQCVVLQEKFRSLGLRFTSRTRMRAFCIFTHILIVVVCVCRQVMFTVKHTPWYRLYCRLAARTISLGFWAPEVNSTSDTTRLYFGIVGVVFDGFLTNYWFYCQVFHLLCVLTTWMVFQKLNSALKSGHFQIKHLPEVMDLHFHSIKLLNAINQLISPLTFWSMTFNIICMCFWTNHIALDYRVSVKTYYVAGLFFFLKTLTGLILEANVNAKAHQISEWLEDSCTTTEKFPVIDPIKFAIFKSQVYSKDCTGFKGLNFFVVTPSLAIAVAGIVMTYTVAVSQFCQQRDSPGSG